MKRNFAFVSLAAFALLGAGCVVEHGDHHHGDYVPGPGTPTRFDLTIFLTFDGATCAQAPEVDTVRLRLEGPAVADETLLCPPEGGRVFEDIPRGTYTWRVDGLAADGTLLYTGSGVVDLFRDATVHAVLRPVGEPPVEEVGLLTFFWTFAGQTCAEAGVAEVRVTIPGQFDEALACSEGGVEGITIENVLAGETAWTLTGTDPGGATVLYEASGTATVPADGEVQVNADLSPVGVEG